MIMLRLLFTVTKVNKTFITKTQIFIYYTQIYTI